MGNSIESSRPIMAPSVASKRTSKRFSTFSGAPSSLLPSGAENQSSSDIHSTHSAQSHGTSTTMTSGDPRMQEIKEWGHGFDRLEQKRLQQQRYAPTPEKTDSLSKLALGAKVERALGRRMTDQDATFRRSFVGGGKSLSEKESMRATVSTRAS